MELTQINCFLSLIDKFYFDDQKLLQKWIEYDQQKKKDQSTNFQFFKGPDLKINNKEISHLVTKNTIYMNYQQKETNVCKSVVLLLAFDFIKSVLQRPTHNQPWLIFAEQNITQLSQKIHNHGDTTCGNFFKKNMLKLLKQHHKYTDRVLYDFANLILKNVSLQDQIIMILKETIVEYFLSSEKEISKNLDTQKQEQKGYKADQVVNGFRNIDKQKDISKIKESLNVIACACQKTITIYTIQTDQTLKSEVFKARSYSINNAIDIILIKNENQIDNLFLLIQQQIDENQIRQKTPDQSIETTFDKSRDLQIKYKNVYKVSQELDMQSKSDALEELQHSKQKSINFDEKQNLLNQSLKEKDSLQKQNSYQKSDESLNQDEKSQNSYQINSQDQNQSSFSSNQQILINQSNHKIRNQKKSIDNSQNNDSNTKINNFFNQDESKDDSQQQNSKQKKYQLSTINMEQYPQLFNSSYQEKNEQIQNELNIQNIYEKKNQNQDSQQNIFFSNTKNSLDYIDNNNYHEPSFHNSFDNEQQNNQKQIKYQQNSNKKYSIHIQNSEEQVDQVDKNFQRQQSLESNFKNNLQNNILLTQESDFKNNQSFDRQQNLENLNIQNRQQYLDPYNIQQYNRQQSLDSDQKNNNFPERRQSLETDIRLKIKDIRNQQDLNTFQKELKLIMQTLESNLNLIETLAFTQEINKKNDKKFPKQIEDTKQIQQQYEQQIQQQQQIVNQQQSKRIYNQQIVQAPPMFYQSTQLQKGAVQIIQNNARIQNIPQQRVLQQTNYYNR